MTRPELGVIAAVTISSSLLALLFSSPAGAQSWIAFGDSLTDTGNAAAFTGGAIPDPTFYKNGRFSNGEVWFDRLAGSHGLLADHLIGTPGKAQHDWNFAVGGATTGNEPLDAVAGTPPGLQAQVASARGLISNGSVRVGRDTTAVLWAGANDHGQWLTSPTRVASGDLAIASMSANNIDAGARAIATSGVGTVAVLNLFDFSLAPTTAFLTSDVRAAGDVMARHHNALLLSLQF